MHIAYFDETGDDGYPDYSSELFVLTSVYLNHHDWKNSFEELQCLRRTLKSAYGFPVKLELHTNKLIKDKNPYRQFNWDIQDKMEIIRAYFDIISCLNLKIINVVINKRQIKSKEYGVLDRALTYNIQRIENDLRRCEEDNEEKFLIITDEGRVGKMRKTTRRIQKINYIPSKLYGGYYRQEVERLIEDPLPKESSESHFIQIADIVSFFVYLYALKEFNNAKWGNRIGDRITFNEVVSCLSLIKGNLNLEASKTNEFGIVHYPL